MKQVVVHKYGGNSLATIEHFLQVAEFISEELVRNPGTKIIAVVSAMKGETDRLLGDFEQLIGDSRSSSAGLREMGMLGSLGEDRSASYLAAALIGKGRKAKSLNCFQAGINSTNQRDKAKIVSINKNRLIEELVNNDVLVVTGFQGVPLEAPDEVALLDRGGTDIAAVAIAHCLETECIFFKKGAGGVQCVDPEFVKNAPVIERMTYQSCIAMNSYGYAYLHPRAVKLAQRYGITLEFRATPGYPDHNPHAKGTIIDWGEQKTIEYIDDKFAAICTMQNLNLLYVCGIPNIPGEAIRFYRALSGIDFIDSTQLGGKDNASMSAILPSAKKGKTLQKVMELLKSDFGFSCEIGSKPITMITYYDYDIGPHSTFFEQIATITYELGVNIEYEYSSENMIHICVSPEDAKKLVPVLAKKLGLVQ